MVLNMRNGSLWDFQTLLRNWVVIKVVFGCSMKHVARCVLVKMGFAPLIRERYLLGPSKCLISEVHGHASVIESQSQMI